MKKRRAPKKTKAPSQIERLEVWAASLENRIGAVYNILDVIDSRMRRHLELTEKRSAQAAEEAKIQPLRAIRAHLLTFAAWREEYSRLLRDCHDRDPGGGMSGLDNLDNDLRGIAERVKHNLYGTGPLVGIR